LPKAALDRVIGSGGFVHVGQIRHLGRAGLDPGELVHGALWRRGNRLELKVRATFVG
jgi:hypothetical protein